MTENLSSSSSSSSSSTFKPNNIVVIGGEGFLGFNLTVGLLKSYPQSKIFSLDLVQRNFDYNHYLSNLDEISRDGDRNVLRHEFLKVDLTDSESISRSFEEIRPELVFHTASPWTGSGKEICERVNVQGTMNVLEACQKSGVQRLVYTSSAGVVYNGIDLLNVDERLPYPKVPFDHYNLTKAKAETLVLEANGKGSLLTCSLRPAGIFGPGDRQAIPSIIQIIKNGQHRIQIGRNKNLFDWTYVDNVVHSHILASQKLDRSVPLSAFSRVLQPIWKTNPRRILTTSLSSRSGSEKGSSSSRSSHNTTDDGELINLSTISLEASPLGHDRPKSKEMVKSGSGGEKALFDQPLVAKRNRWDQWSPISTGLNHPSGSVSVAGQAFFITGGEPVFFWDFTRSVWSQYVSQSRHAKEGLKLDPHPNIILILPSLLAIFLAYLVEGFSKVILRRQSNFKVSSIKYSCVNRFHSIEKARVVLDYEPVVGVEEGIKRSIQWYVSKENEEILNVEKKKTQ